MKYIVFGNIDCNTSAVLHNIPYKIEYVVTNSNGCEGCGTQQLRKFIPDTIHYIGVDYIGRGNDTLTADFNNMQFPSQQADTVFCSGCLEYIENADWFIERMCKCESNEIIVSYCCLEYCMDIQQRRRCGWKNHMTIRQIIAKFAQYGFTLEYTEKSIGLNLIFKFVKSKGGGRG